MKRGFTLIEIIIVIIIVGVLAAIGLSQYSEIVEKSRLAEAKVRIGAMRQLAYEYYLNNGSLTGITNSGIGVNGYACTPSDFYGYSIGSQTATWLNLAAGRCTSGGKSPDASRKYYYYLRYYPATGGQSWHCYYEDNGSPCFGLTAS